MNVILLNLVCSDFSVSVLGNPITFLAAISGKNHWLFGENPDENPNHVCVCYGFFMSLLGKNNNYIYFSIDFF